MSPRDKIIQAMAGYGLDAADFSNPAHVVAPDANDYTPGRIAPGALSMHAPTMQADRRRAFAMARQGLPPTPEMQARFDAANDRAGEREDRFARSFFASAPDVMGIPSAAVGMVSPAARDQWRAAQEESIPGRIAGSVAGGIPALRALPAMTTLPRALAAGGATGAASDVIDAGVGNGGFDRDTIFKAALGAATYPVRSRIPGMR